jgi:5-hydroxyisourate hydrolase
VSTISTHILDTSLGKPAGGVRVALERVHAAENTARGMAMSMPSGVATASTDANGRIAAMSDSPIEPGTYHLRFDTAEYFSRTGCPVFYPEVVVTFRIDAADEHFHIPLLLSPFGYSTYRGS